MSLTLTLRLKMFETTLRLSKVLVCLKATLRRVLNSTYRILHSRQSYMILHSSTTSLDLNRPATTPKIPKMKFYFCTKCFFEHKKKFEILRIAAYLPKSKKKDEDFFNGISS